MTHWLVVKCHDGVFGELEMAALLEFDNLDLFSPQQTL